MSKDRKKKKKKNKSKPDVKLAWTFHPLRSNIRHAVLVIFLMLLFCGSVYWNFGDIFLCIMSLVIFIFSLRTFFFPTSYVLEDKAFRVKNIYPVTYPWDRFRRYRKFKRGITLSPYEEPCRLDYYRSVVLFCEDNLSSEILNIVEEKIA